MLCCSMGGAKGLSIMDVLLERDWSKRVIFNLKLRYLFYPGFLLFLYFAPLLRGLFFPADLLPYQVFGGVLLAIAAVDAALRGKNAFGGFLHWAFLWLSVAYGISAVNGVVKSQAILGFIRYSMYFGVFWLSWYVSDGRESRKGLLLTLFLSATTVALVGLGCAVGILEFPGAVSGSRIMSTLQYPNALAAYMMFSSIIGLTLWTLEHSEGLRLIYAVGIFFQSIVFFSSYSRGGWVIYPIAALFMVLGIAKKYRARLVYSICAVLTSVLLVVRPFIVQLESKSQQGALRYVVIGLAVSVIFELAYYVYSRMADKILAPSVRKAFAWISWMYVAFVLFVYVFMLVSQIGLFPQSMAKRFASIRLEDPSLLTRGFATKDAYEIFLDYPLFGGGAGAWNALYHGYQRVLYWTTEVHNHFAQVLVETGLFGFAAYVAVWLTLGVSVVTFWKKKFLEQKAGKRRQTLLLGRISGPRNEGQRKWTRIWGLFVACLALGIHSSMDFELSMPAVAYSLWAVFGVLYRQTHKHGSTSPQKDEAERKRKFAGSVIVLATALLVAISSYVFERAAVYGSLGATALAQHDFLRAIELYRKARSLDPYTASYAMDTAQAYSALSLLERRSDLKDKALAAIEEARELDPNNITHRIREIELLRSLGEPQRALEVSLELTNLVPLDLRVYEELAKNTVIYYMYQLGQSESCGDQKYLDEVISIPDRLEDLKAQITGKYRERWDPDKHLYCSPSLTLYIGQAYYLKGDLDNAVSYLRKAANSRQVKREADIWLTAALIKKGEKAHSVADADVDKVLSYFPSVK